MMSRKINPHRLTYHLLKTMHAPHELVYLDLLRPVKGIRSEYKFVVTAIDGFSRLLATRLIKDRWAQTVMVAIIDIFRQEMGVPSRIVVDRGNEFTAVDTRALNESKLDMKMSFIPAGEHQQNLVE